MVQAWYMDDAPGDPRQPHRPDPDRPVGLEQLRRLGVLYWKSVQTTPSPERPAELSPLGVRGSGLVPATLRMLSSGDGGRCLAPHWGALGVLRMLNSGVEGSAVSSQSLGCVAHAQQRSIRRVLRMLNSGAGGSYLCFSVMPGVSGGSRRVVGWGRFPRAVELAEIPGIG
ncbi:hypothetical protein P7K49_029910 [Saguinus oedipus]|uniref:Uncharacterized protein n=1 Tax=Saguinus oedipus TaxID=9490 RepID=A0ABQ9U911_SAGOE|nr:hypothetical protein P7K49_029910 [Saguinus oedipus]